MKRLRSVMESHLLTFGDGGCFSSEPCFEKTDPNTIFADFCALKSLLGRHDPSCGVWLSIEVIAEVCGFKGTLSNRREHRLLRFLEVSESRCGCPIRFLHRCEVTAFHDSIIIKDEQLYIKSVSRPKIYVQILLQAQNMLVSTVTGVEDLLWYQYQCQMNNYHNAVLS